MSHQLTLSVARVTDDDLKYFLALLAGTHSRCTNSSTDKCPRGEWDPLVSSFLPQRPISLSSSLVFFLPPSLDSCAAVETICSLSQITLLRTSAEHAVGKRHGPNRNRKTDGPPPPIRPPPPAGRRLPCLVLESCPGRKFMR